MNTTPQTTSKRIIRNWPVTTGWLVAVVLLSVLVEVLTGGR